MQLVGRQESVSAANWSYRQGREAAMAVNDQSTLASYWHPIAESKDVTTEPRRFSLLDTDLVAFRVADGGAAAVFKDLCIHRGTPLSLGWVKDDRIVCAYHGWEYDRTGACVRMPS